MNEQDTRSNQPLRYSINQPSFYPSHHHRHHPTHQGWAGYDPQHISGLYPNEVATDFSFLPFGGGARKCIGDQFAIMETTVIMVGGWLVCLSVCVLPLSVDICAMDAAGPQWRQCVRRVCHTSLTSPSLKRTQTQAMLLRRFDFSLATTVEEVGMRTGATIHTEGGLRMRVTPRTMRPPRPAAAAVEEAVAVPVGEGGHGGCPVHH